MLLCIGCVIFAAGQIAVNGIMATAVGMMQNPVLEDIKRKVWIVLACTAGMGLSNFLVVRFSLGFRRNINLELRNLAFSKIIKKTYRDFNIKSKETYISNLVNDINLFDEEFFEALKDLIGLIVQVILSFFIIVYLDWKFSLVVFASAMVCFGINTFFQKPVVNLKNKVSGYNEIFSVEVSNILNGVEILKLNSVEETFLNKTTDAIKKLESKKRTYTLLTGFQESVFSILHLFLRMFFLIYCVKLLFDGISLTYAVLIIQLSSVVAFAAEKIFPRINAYKAAVVIYNKITTADNSDNAKMETVHEIKDFVFNEKISIKNLSYSYEGNIIFDSISFDILKGKKYLIRGISGSGKTTLIHILSKTLENYSGEIFVDGVNLKEIRINSFNEKIAFIFQNVFLFEDSIKNNIQLYKEYTPRKLEVAIKRSGLFDFISEKEYGLDTVLAENGKDLSGGQRQRISIARAIIKDAELLFADEAVSSLEKNLGRQIEYELLNLDLTLLAISHRYYAGVTENYDYIIEVKNKKVEVIPASAYHFDAS